MTSTVAEVDQISILIVDDRRENLLALEGWLEDLDLDIVQAESGNEALGHMLKKDFALVLLDVQMPEIDGFETAELMRGAERTREIPIIFITAANKEKMHVFRGYESGAVDYLTKPFEPHILRSKVNVFVQLYRQKLTLQKTVADLQEALAKVKLLSGLIPICTFCKSIRNDQGYWDRIEEYISEHSEAEFSHSICDKCLEKQYPEEI